MKSPNFTKVFLVFRKNYQLVPLEVFGKNPYKTLVSTLLSARTKDEVTLVASKRIFSQAKNFQDLARTNVATLEKLIYPVGFYKTKAKHLKKLAEVVLEKHKGKVPKTREELVLLPGVGRKTANLVLNRAFQIPAIAVDTHVHRISNLLGWVETKTPEKTEAALNKILPKRYWSDINKLFVSIGRRYGTNRNLKDFLSREKLLN